MSLLGRPYLRFVLPFVVASGTLALPGGRHAVAQDDGIDLEGSNITLELKLPEGEGEFEAPESNVEKREFMNRANCICGDNAASQFAIEFELVPDLSAPPSNRVDIWLGTSCTASADQQERCLKLDTGFDSVADLPATMPISVRDLVSDDGTCPEIDSGRVVYAIIDEAENDIFEDGDYEAHLSIETDTRPPPELSNFEVSPSEGRINIDWERPSSTEDISYFQVLCARADDDTNTREFGGIDARYLTARMACMDEDDDDICILNRASTSGDPDAGTADAGVEADAGTGDAGTGDEEPKRCMTGLPPGLQTLDPAYLCGDQDSSSATSAAAEGLENGVSYHVVLLVIDESRNATAFYLGTETPEPAMDFWEYYKKSGGGAEGGCNVARAGLGGGIGLALTLAFGFGLRSAVRRLRRRGRRGGRGSGPGALTGGAALIFVLAATPRLADAQPWWEDSPSYHDAAQGEEPERPISADPHWGLEFKFGPYVPDVETVVDDEGRQRDPFREMFGGGPFYMGLVTLDRYLLYPMGQLGVSLTAGFLTWSVRAFKEGPDGRTVDDDMNGKPDRSEDTTRLFLIPTSLGVVYRFTEIDNRFRIPIVPYGRLGLSYYLWRINAPDGDVAIVEGDKARGGSLGWQATVGLAVRLERIDRSAEVSLRNELGIDHMGLVFEYTYAKVDGFGSDTKLAVGDATWFGGINVEF